MDKDFWLERWQKGEIGFHEAQVNLYLTRYWEKLQLKGRGKVFVPLCGKSGDMQWLQQQGHEVVGVELSQRAAEDFFSEAGYPATASTDGHFQRFSANNLHILCGDFFQLSRADLAGVVAVYDRAAMVALPQEMRARYVQHMLGILPAGAQILLITFDYPQSEMQGPPFAVSSDEVEHLYQKYAEIEQIAQFDALEGNPRFKQRGMTRLQETISLLRVR